ncbi:MAG: NADH-quinone oxidoreductase subunit A [Planctomycetota bacterium]
MQPELNDYLPVLLTIVIAVGIAVTMAVASKFIGKKAKGNPVKDTPYECGMPIITDSRIRFSVKFYLVAMLFILFDIEVVFLYPWAVVFDHEDLSIGLVLGEMLVFIAILFAGWIYMVKKGVLTWQKPE